MREGLPPVTVGTPSATVTSAGRGRDVVSVYTVRSLGGGLPGERLSPTAEGTVEWAQPSDVMDGTSATPWSRRDGFPLPPGTPVTASVGTVETGEHRVLTAVVDSSQGSADGRVVSDLIDPVDQLHHTVSVPALRDYMPNREDGKPTRLVGVMIDAVVSSILRQCGIGNTPLVPDGFQGVSAPMQGTAWPELGVVDTAEAKASPTSIPVVLTPRGIGISNGIATYEPSAFASIQRGMLIAATITGTGTWSVTAEFEGRSERVRVAATVNRVLAQYYDGTTWSDLVSVPAAGHWDRVGADFTGGQVRLILTDDGSPVQDAQSSVSWPSGLADARMSMVTVDTNTGMSGVMVGSGSAAVIYTHQTLNMVRSGDLTGRVEATPAIVSRTALPLLTEIAHAACRVFWWDEDGVFHWDTAHRLLAAAPVATLTSMDDLLDLSWSESLADTYARVNVDYQTPIVRGDDEPTIDLWQGRGETVDSGNPTPTIITTPDDEDWLVPHLGFREVGTDGALQFNRGRGSWYGGVVGSDPERWASLAGTTSFAVEQTTDTAFKLTLGWDGPSEMVQRTVSDDVGSSIASSRRRFDLPILRGRGKTVWMDENAFYGDGPAAAAEYVHAAGKWVGENPDPVGAFLASWLTVPRVKARGISIVHDPRIQVGDIVRVRDEHAHGVELVGLVTRIEQTTRVDSQDMEIDLFVISGAPTDITLGDHTTEQGEVSLQEHTTGMGSASLATHTSNPSH